MNTVTSPIAITISLSILLRAPVFTVVLPVAEQAEEFRVDAEFKLFRFCY